MRCEIYSNPRQAYELMNKWTDTQNNYETRFQGKRVTAVEVMFEGLQPQFANVQYENRDRYARGCETINLSLYGLRDEPRVFRKIHRRENPKKKVLHRGKNHVLHRRK